jgi:hypothetical protein
MTKQELIALFSNGHLVTGGDFENLINSLKGVQSPVSDPSASGTSVTFIATITQDAEGKITVTKKTVNFAGYQPVSAMAGYQEMDLQQVGEVTVGAGESQTIVHGMKHYPTVRLMDDTGMEVSPSEYQVKHADDTKLDITLGGSLGGSYQYILD